MYCVSRELERQQYPWVLMRDMTVCGTLTLSVCPSVNLSASLMSKTVAASALRHGGHPAVKGSRFFLTGRLLAIAKAPCSKHSKVYFVLFMYEEVKGPLYVRQTQGWGSSQSKFYFCESSPCLLSPCKGLPGWPSQQVIEGPCCG